MADNGSMGRFDASLVIPGDSKPLSAIVVIEDGRLRIRTASHDIGDWSLQDVAFTSLPSGFRMEVEGEELIIELDDHDRFNDDVTANTKKSRRRRRTKDATTTKVSRRPKSPTKSAKDRPANRESRRATAREGDDAVTPTRTRSESRSREPTKGFGAWLDRVLDRAEKRYGALLPPWVFTRGTAIILGLWLLLMLLFPSLISTMLLLAGFLAVVFGAVVYTDGALAARVLPGRSTPNHVLIAGVGLVVLGFLLGVIAN
jgi:hypothetical protein